MRPFPPESLAAIASARILGVRSGDGHRYTGVWVVVVEGRVFARSWNDKPKGWFRAFRVEPVGSIRAGDIEFPIRAKFVRSARVRDAVTAAFAAKYHTVASQKWVAGFAEPARALKTIEFTPAV